MFCPSASCESKLQDDAPAPGGVKSEVLDFFFWQKLVSNIYIKKRMQVSQKKMRREEGNKRYDLEDFKKNKRGEK